MRRLHPGAQLRKSRLSKPACARWHARDAGDCRTDVIRTTNVRFLRTPRRFPPPLCSLRPRRPLRLKTFQHGRRRVARSGRGSSQDGRNPCSIRVASEAKILSSSSIAARPLWVLIRGSGNLLEVAIACRLRLRGGSVPMGPKTDGSFRGRPVVARSTRSTRSTCSTSSRCSSVWVHSQFQFSKKF